MSYNITTAMVREYHATVQILQQQMGSRLQNAVRMESQNGETSFWDQIGATSAVKRTSRHADMPLVSTTHYRRMVATEDYDWADLVDRQDMNKTLADPTSKYSINAAAAMGRAKDTEIIRAFFASAYTDKDGGTATSFPTATHQIAVGSAGLTIPKLISAKEILDSYEVDEMDRYIAVTSTQVSDLLGTTQVTSSDYNTVKALVQGQINSFMGFTFIRTELLGVDSSDYRRCPVWQKNSVLMGVGQDSQAGIDRRVDLAGRPIQVSYSMSIGATRMDEVGVVEILCSES